MHTVLSWNIRQGGGRRAACIVAAIARRRPDTILLSEFRQTPTGTRIRNELARLGWLHQGTGRAAAAADTLFIASRIPFHQHSVANMPLGESHRAIVADFEAFTLLGLLCPLSGMQQPLRQLVLRLPTRYLREPAALAASFSAHAPGLDREDAALHSAGFTEQLTARGWIDAWQHVHGRRAQPSGSGPRGDALRIDHLFVSPATLEQLRGIRYSHREREEGISDHSLLIAELNTSR